MFVVGIFGVMDRKERLGDIALDPCRVCGDGQMGTLFRVERVLSLFFLPVFRWSRRYGVQCARCGTLYWIRQDTGERLLRNELDRIGHWDMLENRMVRGGVCPRCGSRVVPSFRYCPHCGQALDQEVT